MAKIAHKEKSSFVSFSQGGCFAKNAGLCSFSNFFLRLVFVSPFSQLSDIEEVSRATGVMRMIGIIQQSMCSPSRISTTQFKSHFQEEHDVTIVASFS